MAHNLPRIGTPEREMFDLRDLVAIALGKRDPIAGIPAAKAAAKRAFAAYADSELKPTRFCYIVLEGDDRLSLISVGPRGGWKREWTFGWGLTGNSPSKPQNAA